MEALTQPAHLLSPVVHPEDVGAARRRVARMAGEAGVDAGLRANAELAVTELATNLLRHARPARGCILARVAGAGLEVVSVDGGPGIADVEAALHGSVPSPAGLGCGLAGVRRLASDFDIWSRPGLGTAVMARFGAREPGWSGVSVAVEGEQDCGDAWAVADDGERTTVLVVDGLGHGPDAAAAAQAAVAAFSADSAGDLESVAQRLHQAMRGTRGGAAALCRLDRGRRRAEFVGVGNVSGRLVGGTGSQAMVSMNGTLGTELSAPRIRRMAYDLGDGATLLMSTDGVRDGFDINAHPGLLGHDPLLVAAMINRACARGSDDATVVVVKAA